MVEGSTSAATAAPTSADGALSLMGFIRDIPPLKGDNYVEWRKKIDMAFTFAEIDWVIETERPTQPEAPVRATDETDAAWQKRERDFAPIQMTYDIDKTKWEKANKKCKIVVQNTMEPHISDSIPVCDSAKEYLDTIKRQFTGSTKTYATQLIKELISQKYTGGGTGIRDHILRMSHLASKIKKFKDLTITDTFFVHLVFSSLPPEFENFVVNYNMHPETWDLEKTIAMCAQQEEIIKASKGGSINLLKDNKKKNQNSPSQNKGKGQMQHQGKPNTQYQGQKKFQQTMQHLPQQNQFVVNKDQCLYCKKEGHYKKRCPDWLQMKLRESGFQLDSDNSKKRKTY